ncbi:protein spaetzle 4 isoform X1 [Euwallacea similis]|uniref:protein spaetzle 4 isoform X1 n=1 Tax=Euwallacea similis TaxID=1736056 RepID=UPI00344B1EE6
MISCFILLLYACTILGTGYDAGGGDRASCGRPYRAGRNYQPPCDLVRLGYCAHAGNLYPWKAVKRFVKDNQGLMRRMYGDQRHGHVLRAELDELDDFEETWEKREREKGGYGHWRPTPVRFARRHQNQDVENELDQELDFDDFDTSYDEEARYLRDDLTNEDVLNTKFVISEQEAAIAIKLAELKAAAHFRPASHRNQYTTQKTTTAEFTTTTVQKPASIRNITKLIPTTIRKETTTAKVENNEIGGSEQGTLRWSSTTKLTTEASAYLDYTEESTLITTSGSTTTTEDSLEHSTTDTTTERPTEWNSKKITATTFKTTQIPSGDKLGGNGDKAVEREPQDSYNDHTAEFSENSEIFADTEGDLKHTETGNTPAMLFQDMEQDPVKKKPVNFNKMKGFNACPVKEEVVAPFWANNTRGEVLALLNMYPFEQYVHWEKCSYEHKQMYCRDGCRCEQQYRLHRLLAYDPNNECRGIFSDWFKFPSCCVCKCYDMPPEFRVTSRSPRFQMSYSDEDDPNREGDKYG